MNDKLRTYRHILLALRGHLRGEMNLLVDIAHDLAIERRKLAAPKVCRTCQPSWRTTVAGLVGATINELLRRKEKMLDQIDEALERLDDGTFGICWECDSQIPDAWLTTMPYADRCTQCESQRLMDSRGNLPD